MNYKSYISLSLLASSILLSGYAIAEDKPSNNKDYYVQLNLGGSVSNSTTIQFNVNNKTYKGTGNVPSGLAGFEAGAKVVDNFRVAISLDYRPVYPFQVKDGSKEIGTLDASSFSTMLNAYYDFTNSSNFTPYLTVGAGFASNHTKIDQKNNGLSVASKTTNNFAYKLGLGTRYSINENFDFDIRYQYVDLGKYKFSNSATLYGVNYPVQNASEVSMRIHEVLVGVAYKF